MKEFFNLQKEQCKFVVVRISETESFDSKENPTMSLFLLFCVDVASVSFIIFCITDVMLIDDPVRASDHASVADPNFLALPL